MESTIHYVTRPLSILRIRYDIRSKYARLSKQVMTAMLTPEGEYIYIVVGQYFVHCVAVLHVAHYFKSSSPHHHMHVYAYTHTHTMLTKSMQDNLWPKELIQVYMVNCLQRF